MAIGRNRQPKHISACACATGTFWVAHENNWPVQGQKHDPWLLSPVSQPIKPPGPGKVPFFRENKHMLKPLTLDQLWILSSRGLPVPCPVCHYDSSTARENGGLVARDLVT